MKDERFTRLESDQEALVNNNNKKNQFNCTTGKSTVHLLQTSVQTDPGMSWLCLPHQIAQAQATNLNRPTQQQMWSLRKENFSHAHFPNARGQYTWKCTPIIECSGMVFSRGGPLTVAGWPAAVSELVMDGLRRCEWGCGRLDGRQCPFKRVSTRILQQAPSPERRGVGDARWRPGTALAPFAAEWLCRWLQRTRIPSAASSPEARRLVLA